MFSSSMLVDMAVSGSQLYPINLEVLHVCWILFDTTFEKQQHVTQQGRRDLKFIVNIA